MLRGVYTAAAGMIADSTRLDIRSQNLANLNTPGYKRSMEVAQSFPEIFLHQTRGVQQPRPVGRLGTGVQIQAVIPVLEEGELRRTEGPMDLALVGEGFFTLQTDQGQELYTRNGSFRRSADGYLVTANGDLVMGESGPIWLPLGDLRVDGRGSILVDGELVGRLLVTRFENPQGLRSEAGVRLVAGEGAGPNRMAEYQVIQGALEGSNANPVIEMVRMIELMRAYEASQKAIHVQDGALERLIQEFGSA